MRNRKIIKEEGWWSCVCLSADDDVCENELSSCIDTRRESNIYIYTA
jgi:hypothetical protein